MKHLIKFTIASIAFLILINFSARSQNNSSNKIDSTRRAQNIYIEMGAAGLFYSVNYDTRFSQQRDGLGARLGIGYWHALRTNTTFYTVPFQLNYLIGKKRSFLELGAGATLMELNGTYGDPLLDTHLKHPISSSIVPVATIGYRYQPLKHGINVRVNFDPLLLGGTVLPYFGLSLGYTFK